MPALSYRGALRWLGARLACRLGVSCGEPLLSRDMAHANTWCWGALSL